MQQLSQYLYLLPVDFHQTICKNKCEHFFHSKEEKVISLAHENQLTQCLVYGYGQLYLNLVSVKRI